MPSRAHNSAILRTNFRNRFRAARSRRVLITAGVAGAVSLTLTGPAGYAAPSALPLDQAAPSAGRVITWGGATQQEHAALQPPTDLDDAIAITASDTWQAPAGPSAYDLALRSDGTVIGWGLAQFGEATPPADLRDVTAIDTGAGFSVALKSDGSVVTWGSNFGGQRELPADLGRVVAVAAGGQLGSGGMPCGFGLALTAEGKVVRWGGTGCTDPARLDPPADLTDVVAISAGEYGALALRADGTVVGWGGGSPEKPPADLTDAVAISAGNNHNLALRAGGQVVGWGTWGEEGPPRTSGVSAIDASDQDVMLRQDGSISLYHPSGTIPKPTDGDFVAVAAGYQHGAAIVSAPDTERVALGTTEVQPSIDQNPAGTAEAFRSVATASGRSARLKIYLDRGSKASKVEVGLYSDRNGHPGTLLAAGQLTSPVAGDWNTVEVPAVDVTKGTRYWLAVLGPKGNGTVKFRDLPGGTGGATETSAQTGLKALPATWKSGQSYENAPASLHLQLG